MNVILRAAAAYWILLFALRFLGRRTSSQLAPLDLVVLNDAGIGKDDAGSWSPAPR